MGDSATVKVKAAQFKELVQSLQLEKKSWLNVEHLPAGLAKWLKAYCKRKGVYLTIEEPTTKYYKILYATPDMEEAAKKKRDKQARSRDDYYNSPG